MVDNSAGAFVRLGSFASVLAPHSMSAYEGISDLRPMAREVRKVPKPDIAGIAQILVIWFLSPLGCRVKGSAASENDGRFEPTETK